jgi:hypothetical protein
MEFPEILKKGACAVDTTVTAAIVRPNCAMMAPRLHQRGIETVGRVGAAL